MHELHCFSRCFPPPRLPRHACNSAPRCARRPAVFAPGSRQLSRQRRPRRAGHDPCPSPGPLRLPARHSSAAARRRFPASRVILWRRRPASFSSWRAPTALGPFSRPRPRQSKPLRTSPAGCESRRTGRRHRRRARPPPPGHRAASARCSRAAASGTRAPPAASRRETPPARPPCPASGAPCVRAGSWRSRPPPSPPAAGRQSRRSPASACAARPPASRFQPPADTANSALRRARRTVPAPSGPPSAAAALRPAQTLAGRAVSRRWRRAWPRRAGGSRARAVPARPTPETRRAPRNSAPVFWRRCPSGVRPWLPAFVVPARQPRASRPRSAARPCS